MTTPTVPPTEAEPAPSPAPAPDDASGRRSPGRNGRGRGRRADQGPEQRQIAETTPIQVEGVTMRFGELEALRDVTLSVDAGTILGVIGPSGAGKTTLIRMLTGGITPTDGKATVLGRDPRRFNRRTRERLGYMPQLFTLYPDLTAGENVDFVASLFGLLFFRRRARVRKVLELVELWDARGRRAIDLSGGMQRRLELACALVHDPDVLFLDEPTAGIDPLLRSHIWEELHRLKDAGRTMIVTTQYVNEAEECDRVALIANGRLAALAEPDELRRQATGGDVIEVETARAFDGASLEREPFVRKVVQTSPRSMQVTVDEAGTATPDVMEAITRSGGEVVTAREYRLTFDEVFAELVAQEGERPDASRDGDASQNGEPPAAVATAESHELDDQARNMPDGHEPVEEGALPPPRVDPGDDIPPPAPPAPPASGRDDVREAGR